MFSQQRDFRSPAPRQATLLDLCLKVAYTKDALSLDPRGGVSIAGQRRHLGGRAIRARSVSTYRATFRVRSVRFLRAS